MGYHFTLCYKPGNKNRVADALSRIHEDAELSSMLSYPQWFDGASLLQGYDSDTLIQKYIQDITVEPISHPGFTIVNGKLYHKNRLVIPSTSSWVPKLLEEFHTSPNGGHSGFYRTYRRLGAHIYWFGMVKTVKNICSSL
ncbi:uncharacterized protein [Rutidosis leptorrhynchoides]|uniref:uncharacterized protein n=1 Tax=Rutidosis leptorrhynchoides TaxID=125765 RepID=UPI003A98F12F